jgi:uncharacterized membrane protein
MDPISEYIAVALASTFKFVGGPVAGISLGLSLIETTLCSAAGMMVTVFLITYGNTFGGKLLDSSLMRKWKESSLFKRWAPKERKRFTRMNRLGVKVKSKLGLWGLAFLTPFLFTPILGTFLALRFRFPINEILSKMLICGLVAGFIQTLAINYLRFLF